MILKAIEKIASMAAPNILEHESRKYADKQLTGIRPPMPESLAMHTLSGICGWLKSLDNLASKCMLHILDHQTVQVIGGLEKNWMTRPKYIECSPPTFSPFRFGMYYEIEEFIISVQSRFVDTNEKKELIDYVSKVRGDLVTTGEDDGIAQTVTVEDKVGRLEQAQMSPIVQLRPFRTFPEIEQPQSPFLLRMKSTGGNLPHVALFEVDGGQWKNKAICNISEYLKKQAVVGEEEIDVIG